MTGCLNVFLNTDKVGDLHVSQGGRLIFKYAASWLQNDSAVPLSLSLPLQENEFEDDLSRPFFSNLLPESEIRSLIARKLGLSEKNDFALLEAVGGECAGAVSLISDDDRLQEYGGYRELDDDALNALIADLPKNPLLAGEEGIRLSLAGAQNKLPVKFDGKQVGLPLGAAPSSHILKPPIPHYPETVENEYFCMQLANNVGLPVPKVEILQIDQPLYLIERYDRRRESDGTLFRIHQEDFCQALGINPDQKYEKEGGPGLAQCFELIREHSVTPVADMPNLLRWVVFNYLIGNADAHGKNISLLLKESGPMLAPFYDLLSTEVYPELAKKMAMKIGDENRPDWMIGERWRTFSEEVEIGFKLVRKVLVQMKEQVSEEAKMLANQYHDEHGECDIINRIVDVVEERKKKITNFLEAVG